ncbi:MAG: methylmalonyl-CoA mutase family protein [Bacteroidetes bacterium]|nr:methylmalonyl-CoA mutase family protein [Bacteroidota bacterium]
MEKGAKKTDSGIDIKKVYTIKDLPENLNGDLLPGEFPYTRGVQADMYRGKLWTMRQYAGFSTAEESNKRYHFLLGQGVMGLSVAFDLPTQIGYDADDALAEGEVGKVGVSICSLEDMEILFKDIPLDKISTSMTINSTAFILLAFYVALAKKRGTALDQLTGTIQNDILKEYAARGTYIYPPKPSMRIITDIFEYCGLHLPKWNSISISGYHIREAGSTAVQEIAFTLSNGKAYVEAAKAKGLDINVFGKRLSFFFNAHNNLFEEVAKFRAARKIWAQMMKDLGATDEKALMLRFHTQTGGATLTAQQPLNNISRVTIQTIAAVLGGTQSLHTNGYDEALGLPTENAASIALRTQQVVAFESGIADSADPLAGSYFVENLTNEMEEKALALIKQIDEMGGSVPAIENGFMQNKIAESAYAYQKAIESKEKIIVGVNEFQSDNTEKIPIMRINEAIRIAQIEKIKILKATRDQNKVNACLKNIKDTASSSNNLMPSVIEAVEHHCTLGEIAGVLRAVFGEYQA